MNIKISQVNQLYSQISIQSLLGQEVLLFTVGASLIKWTEKSGINVVARYNDPLDYLKPGMYLGTTVGMNSGRIENGEFFLGGKNYHIHGEHPHFLHGGDNSLSFQNFDFTIEKNTDSETIVCFSNRYHAEYLPGHQFVLIRYLIREDEITIQYDVTSDQLTLCNLTNHSYFNLEGDFTHPIQYHELQLPSAQVCLVNADFIGKQLIDVAQTNYDFMQYAPVLERVEVIRASQDPAFGLDHYFPFISGKQQEPIRLRSTKSGLELFVETSYPGVTVYSTNFPNSKAINEDKKLALTGAICLETQFASNAINDSRFQVGLVSPAQPYHHFIRYRIERNAK